MMRLRSGVAYRALRTIGHQSALGVALVALVLYVRTAAPSVATIFDDSLEFHVVIPLLGVPHPPGYPLYTLVAKAWTFLVPWRDPAWRLNVLSALWAAAAAGVLVRATRAFVPAGWAATVAGLLLVLSPTFWSQATIAEVYALHALFLAGFLALLAPTFTEPSRVTPRRWWALAFWTGLSLTHHRMTLLWAPALVYALVWHRARLPRNARFWAVALGALVAPLGLYLYIPLVGARVGSLDGTYVNSWQGFWDWVLARAYRVFLTENPFNVQRGWADYVRLYVREMGVPALGLTVVGLIHVRRRGALWGWLLLLLATHAAFVAAYKVVDIEVFFLSVVLLSVPLVAGGLVAVAAAGARLAARVGPREAGYAGVALVLTAVVLAAVVPARLARWDMLDRSDDWQVYDLGWDMVHQPLPEGSVVVGILGETTLIRYFRDVLGFRPDLVVIPADREEARHAAIARALAAGRAVFITRPLPGAPERYSLDAQGPLVRVWPKGQDDRPQPEVTLSQPFTPAITLAGYRQIVRETHAGPVVRVVLYWDVIAPPGDAYKVSARLLRPDGSVAVAVDDVPVHNTYPTRFWVPGERVVDVYDLPRTERDTPQVLIILYRAANGQEVHRVTFPAP